MEQEQVEIKVANSLRFSEYGDSYTGNSGRVTFGGRLGLADLPTSIILVTQLSACSIQRLLVFQLNVNVFNSGSCTDYVANMRPWPLLIAFVRKSRGAVVRLWAGVPSICTFL
jgi:hypothetical protein